MQLGYFIFVAAIAAAVAGVPNGHRQKPAESLETQAEPSSKKGSSSGIGIGLGLGLGIHL
ncbi:hypothetical protein H4R20_004764 [Coemansia guatemalensis]|uniref:Uncharacterized protein n=1 Tax=Coemansia guatemalensis TaxID=2761395 RepID=A0A9W8HY22_9FUNG|nr:hypothetical protein H4R20_004764 [Coemansia guatemalensis]